MMSRGVVTKTSSAAAIQSDRLLFEELHAASGNICANGTISKMRDELIALRTRKGRLFIIGVGGGAANASHAVNDFRKLCGIEAYAPTDGIAELTARANDDGWDTIFSEWLFGSNLNDQDVVLVFSVGGGYSDVSVCISKAVALSKVRGTMVMGVVGCSDGAVGTLGDVVAVVQVSDSVMLTPVTETMQMAIVHALVSDPRLAIQGTKW